MRIYKILQKNSFPRHVIDRVTRSFVDSLYKSSEDTPSIVSNDETPQDKKYFKLPYHGKYSSLVKKKLEDISRKYCKSTLAKIVFVSHKVGSVLSPKDRILSKYIKGINFRRH